GTRKTRYTPAAPRPVLLKVHSSPRDRMNGRKRRNAPMTRTARPVNLSKVHAIATPATANARPRTARNTRAGSTGRRIGEARSRGFAAHANLITSGKVSYRVRPDRRMLPNRDEVDEEQILAALLGVAEMAGDLTDPEELLAAIVRITPGLVGVDRCAVLGYDKQAREFRTLAAFGPGGTPTPFEG